ncbi:hypothetical protein ACTFIW_012753 [Dictyostelium discoideum]
MEALLTISTILQHFDPATKIQHARGILNNRFLGVDLVLNLRDDIKSITLDNAEAFSRKLRSNVQEIIENFVQSDNGILDLGPHYSKYIRIREKIQRRVIKVVNDTQLNQIQKKIIIYCLLPIYYLPNYNRNYNPDTETGEKKFSKMLLNIAVMHSRSKYEYVLGYYDGHQESL